MKIKPIALATAALASSAVGAEPAVVISGRVDAGYVHTRASKLNGAADRTSGIDSGVHDGSRFSIAGREALGNGLSAIFNLEYRITNDIDTGLGNSPGNKAREQYVGLTGKFGTLTAGRMYTPGDDISLYNAMTQSFFSPRLALLNKAGMGNTRFSNAVKYKTNDMQGLSLAAIYGFAPVTGTDGRLDSDAYASDQERGIGLGANYTAGPLSIGLYYDRLTDVNGAAGNTNGIARLGGSYNFGVATVLATYEHVREAGDTEAQTIAGFGSDRGSVWSLGAAVPFGGNGTIRVQYSGLRLRDAAHLDNDGARGWGLGFDYNLSKRTMLYTGYSRLDAQSATTVTHNAGPASGLGGSTALYGAGVVHKF